MSLILLLKARAAVFFKKDKLLLYINLVVRHVKITGISATRNTRSRVQRLSLPLQSVFPLQLRDLCSCPPTDILRTYSARCQGILLTNYN